MAGRRDPEDLFGAALNDRLASQAPLASRLRPRTLDEMVGQEHLLGPGKPLRALIETDRLSSVILWGPPGTGKTTLARLIAGATSRYFVPLSAVSAGVKDVRETIEGARLQAWRVNRGVGCARDGVPMPGNHKQNAAIAGPRHHQRRVPLQEGAIEDQVNPLAGYHQRVRCGVSHAAH